MTDLGQTGSGSASWNAGHLEATEFAGDVFVLLAPEKFRGDKSSYLGGTFSFDLADATRDGIAYPNLILKGNGLAIAYSTPAPSAAGTRYDFSLTPDGWKTLTGAKPTQAQFNSVLDSLDIVAINADWTTAGTDIVKLDNVVMTPVPEPAMMASLGLGLLGFLRYRPRSK